MRDLGTSGSLEGTLCEFSGFVLDLPSAERELKQLTLVRLEVGRTKLQNPRFLFLVRSVQFHFLTRFCYIHQIAFTREGRKILSNPNDAVKFSTQPRKWEIARKSSRERREMHLRAKKKRA